LPQPIADVVFAFSYLASWRAFKKKETSIFCCGATRNRLKMLGVNEQCLSGGALVATSLFSEQTLIA
jgi:hypothetical protein